MSRAIGSLARSLIRLAASLLLVACVAASPAHAEAASASKIALANQYLELTDFEKSFKTTFDLMTQRLQKTQAQGMLDYIRNGFDIQKLRRETLQVVLDLYTEDELKAAIDFYGSPAGRSILEKQLQFRAALAPMIQAEVNELIAKYRAPGSSGQPVPGGTITPVQHG